MSRTFLEMCIFSIVYLVMIIVYVRFIILYFCCFVSISLLCFKLKIKSSININGQYMNSMDNI